MRRMNKNENNVTYHTDIYSKLQGSATKMTAKPRNYRKSNSADIRITSSPRVFSALNGKSLQNLITMWDY